MVLSSKMDFFLNPVRFITLRFNLNQHIAEVQFMINSSLTSINIMKSINKHICKRFKTSFYFNKNLLSNSRIFRRITYK